MPIIVSVPANEPFGPGYRLSLTTDTPGPWPADTHWNIRWLSDPEATSGQEVQDIPTLNANDIQLFTMSRGSQGDVVWEPTTGRADGETNAVQFRLMTGETIQESVTVPIITDLRSVTQRDTAVLINQGAGVGGFTEDDRVVLMQTNAGALALLTEFIADNIWPWIAGKFAPAQTEVLLSPVICGPAIIVRPGLSLFFRWVGLRWQVISHPAGIGTIEGFPDHLYSNWGQLTYCRLSSDGLIHAETSNYEDRLVGEWVWGTREPANIQVYVLPGVCVQFWALAVIEPALRVQVLAELEQLPWIRLDGQQAV